jgi:CspA family cold shock protein
VQGTVKWFSDAKGYGFIAVDDGGGDCFVHHTSIQMEGRRTLVEGARVEFDVVPPKIAGKNPEALNVRVVGIADVRA